MRSQGDFGFYSCVATNSRGSETYYMEVYERGKLNMLWFTFKFFLFSEFKVCVSTDGLLRGLEQEKKGNLSSMVVLRLCSKTPRLIESLKWARAEGRDLKPVDIFANFTLGLLFF